MLLLFWRLVGKMEKQSCFISFYKTSMKKFTKDTIFELFTLEFQGPTDPYILALSDLEFKGDTRMYW